MPPAEAEGASPTVITPALLRDHPLPDHGNATSKHDRGAVLVVGGGRDTPGAVLLAGIAALRVGAGTLVAATSESVAPAVAVALPEARVIGLAERIGGDGDVDGDVALAQVRTKARSARAVLIGPGMTAAGHLDDLVAHLLDEVPETTVVLDAGALGGLRSDAARAAADRIIALPNPAEMATLLEVGVDDVLADLPAALADALERFGVTIALRGSETWIGGPGGPMYVEQGGHPTLGTSGSGDVLVGAVVGLAARGAGPLEAVVWGVHAHATAGERLAARGLGMGALARELLDELPLALRGLQP